MSVCMFMTVVPGIQISSGVVPSIRTWDNCVQKIFPAISSSTRSASASELDQQQEHQHQQHQHWISLRILPGHHPGAPRTAGRFSDLDGSLQSRQSWTWWGGWRRRPGRAGSGRRETASRFLLLPSSSSCRLSDGRFLYWDLSSVSPTYKPRLTRQSFQAFLLSVECCGRLSVGRRLMCIEYVYC